jgi:hypothetical protein
VLHQIRYRFKKQPTREDIEAARAAFIAGKPLPAGVSVEPITWTKGGRSVTELLRERAGFCGVPGLVKIYGAPDLTLCDFDSEWRPPIYVIARIARMLRIRPLWIREDRTARGWHVIIRWNRRFKPVEIVALQCVLGSDRQREAYNLARVFSGKARNQRWNLLFERKVTE